jgi:hypothetical protein
MPGVDPRSLIPTCVRCGERVRPSAPGVWYEVVGWAENRGATGGSNAVALKKPTGRYTCAVCMTLARKGATNQETLL